MDTEKRYFGGLHSFSSMIAKVCKKPYGLP